MMLLEFGLCLSICYDRFILFLLYTRTFTFLLTLGLDVALCLSSFVSLLHMLPQRSFMFYFLNYTLPQCSFMHSHRHLGI